MSTARGRGAINVCFPLVLLVDANPGLAYKATMICASRNLMTSTVSRAVGVGPKGMRVR